jgi:spermidine synthase
LDEKRWQDIVAAEKSVIASANRKMLFASIFLTSLAGLVLEVAITRIFSAAIWYHYAFAAVSLALVGLGASGLAVQFFSRRTKDTWSENLAVFSAWAIVVFIPITLFVMHSLASQVTYLPLFMFLFAVPFFFIGIIISSAFNAFAAVASRLYASDLIGASVGAILVVLFLTVSGGEGATLIVGVIVATSATILSQISKNKKKTVVSVGLLGFAISLLMLNYVTQVFSIPTDPTALKDLPIYLREHPGSKIVKTQWNSFSRIDVVEGGKGDEGLVAKIFIDGGAGTNIIAWDGNVQSRQELTTWLQYLPFKAISDPKVLVIGSGGGRDVVAALVSQSKDVTSVEINPIIFQIVKSYGDKAGNVYTHQYVRAYNDEGRSFINRATEKYDIIYIPFVDTWASVSSGGLSVSENFLYTLEGFDQYYSHLTDRGKIVTVRWLIDTPRFVSTYVKLLEQKGIPQSEVYKHLIIATGNSFTNDPSPTMVVFSKAPFTDDEIKFFSSSIAKYGYKPILIPGQVIREPYASLLNNKIGLEQFYNSFQTKAFPVSDDSPYFLSYEKPFPDIIQNLLKWSIVIAIAFLIIPFLWMRSRNRANNGLHFAGMMPYFAALGMGFILIELGLMQKLILLLGNPTLTFAVLLFTLLLSSGAGSLLSSRLIRNNTRNLTFVIIGIAALGFLYVTLLPSAIYSVISQPLQAKVAVSIMVLAPIGFLMGMPLPTGIRLLKINWPEYIPWMWAVNGAFSVLGAVLSVIIAIMYGSSEAMMLGISIYFVALGISFAWKKKNIISVPS